MDIHVAYYTPWLYFYGIIAWKPLYIAEQGVFFKNLFQTRSEEPRGLLGAIGYSVEEMKNSDRCCGFGGTYSFLSHPQISKQINADKVEAIEETNCNTVAMDCPGCMIMLKGAMGKADPSIRCVHTMELMAEALDSNE